MGIEQVLAERGRGAAEVLVCAGPGYVPLRWAPDRVELAIGTPGGVTLAALGGVVRALAGHDGVHEIGWSPDARVLAMSAEDGGFPGVRAISAENGALLWSYVQGRESIDELRWSPDGRWIAALGSDVLVLDAASGALHLRLWPLERSQEVDEVVWSPSSRWLLLRARSRRGALGGFRVCAVADGSTVVVGSIGDEDYVGWTDGFEALFSDGTDRLAARPTSITDRFRRSLVYTRDGAHAAAEGEEHVLWIERPTGVMRIDGHPRTITALVMTPRGDVATGCRDGGVRLVRAGGDRLQLCWQAPAGERVEGLAWADDGAWLAVKSDKCVRLLPV